MYLWVADDDDEGADADALDSASAAAVGVKVAVGVTGFGFWRCTKPKTSINALFLNNYTLKKIHLYSKKNTLNNFKM